MTVDRLGDEITTLAAHLHAATCRWLELVGEFDAREGWAAWGCRSCAHWISWRCSVALGPAREHVRVARRLRELPLVRAAFATGELSFSKVRALTRVEDVTREQELLELARASTASQLERIVRGYRGVVLAEADRAHEGRFLEVAHADDGSVVVRGRLSREEGAVLLRALEAARDREAASWRRKRTERDGVPAGTSGARPPEQPALGARNADALVLLADESLAARAEGEAPERGRSGGDRYQVMLHVDGHALCGDDAGRCELEGGEPLAVETARRLSCDAALVRLVERDGRPLSVGRKTRSIPPALRRALRSRDGGCRFPSCTQHRWVDAHHIEHWANGGETKLGNLVQLCRHHHRLLHEGGFRVEPRPGGGLQFRRPDGRPLHPVPRQPRRGDPAHPMETNRRLGHTVTATTCEPRWYGEPLDLPAAVEALLLAAPPGHGAA